MSAELEAYYAALPREGGLVAQCRMALEGVDLAGKRVLDVGCRRGKGVFKLSEQVGADGYVVGVDWRPDFVDTARKAASAKRFSGQQYGVLPGLPRRFGCSRPG